MFTLNNTVFKNGDVIENIHINAIKNLATASMNLKQEAMEKLTAYQNETRAASLRSRLKSAIENALKHAQCTCADAGRTKML